MILHLLKNTIHRGIKNQADYDRPMFFIYLTPDKDFMIKGAGKLPYDDLSVQDVSTETWRRRNRSMPWDSYSHHTS